MKSANPARKGAGGVFMGLNTPPAALAGGVRQEPGHRSFMASWYTPAMLMTMLKIMAMIIRPTRA